MDRDVKCPACKKTFYVPYDLGVGDIAECPECGTELIIISSNPTEVREEFTEVDDYANDYEYGYDRER